jgi:hypothetical protein
MAYAPIVSVRPALQLADVVGPGKTFNPRQPYLTTGISPDSDEDCDGFTGAYLVAAGPMRVMCHEAAATGAARELLAMTGQPVRAELLTYRDRTEYDDMLARSGPGEVVYQHLHPPEEAPPSTYAVSRPLLAELTDKAVLHHVVDFAHLARRRVVPTSELVRSVADDELPVVVKASCEESLGGGDGVRFCRTPADVARAAVDFAPAPAAVVEEMLDIVDNWCVNFAVRHDGVVQYLGAAEQIVSPAGVYVGSRVGPPPWEEAVDLGYDIADAARRRGYVGMAGFDIVRTADGRTLALDLNFRFNACTAALLLREALVEWSGRPYGRVAGFRANLPDGPLLEAVGRFVTERVFAPTGSFLPESGARRVSGLVLADGWGEAEATVARITAALA